MIVRAILWDLGITGRRTSHSSSHLRIAFALDTDGCELAQDLLQELVVDILGRWVLPLRSLQLYLYESRGMVRTAIGEWISLSVGGSQPASQW